MAQQTSSNQQPDDGFEIIRSPEGHFLFRYNRERRLIEIKRGRLLIMVDLELLDTQNSKPAVYSTKI